MNRYSHRLIPVVLSLGLAACGGGDGVSKPKVNNPPTLSVDDITVNEGASGAFNVSLSAASADSVSFSWHFGGGSATTAVDYVATDGSTTILPGATHMTIPVSVNTDANNESTETFQITLQNPVGASFSRSVGVCTIPGTPTAVSFASDIAPIVQGRCAISGCHGGSSRNGGLSLKDGTYANIRGAGGNHGAFIGGNPVSSSSSLFYLVVRPGSTSGLPRMPESGGFLSTAQQNTIRDWLDQGALNN